MRSRGRGTMQGVCGVMPEIWNFLMEPPWDGMEPLEINLAVFNLSRISSMKLEYGRSNLQCGFKRRAVRMCSIPISFSTDRVLESISMMDLVAIQRSKRICCLISVVNPVITDRSIHGTVKF